LIRTNTHENSIFILLFMDQKLIFMSVLLGLERVDRKIIFVSYVFFVGIK